MARITLFWCFWTKIFLNGMIEFQVKFCHLSGLRLWRTGMLFSTKSKDRKSNFRIAWMYRYSFYDLNVQFWWPYKYSKHQVLCLNTLYEAWCNVNKKVVISLSWQVKNDRRTNVRSFLLCHGFMKKTHFYQHCSAPGNDRSCYFHKSLLIFWQNLSKVPRRAS